MIRVPWLPHTFGAMTQGLLELIDVFPTLQELAGFPVSPELEGVSHAGLIQALGGGASSGSQQQSGELPPPRTVALAQFPRCIAAGSENASWYWDRNNCNSNTSGEFEHVLVPYPPATEAAHLTAAPVAASSSGRRPVHGHGDDHAHGGGLAFHALGAMEWSRAAARLERARFWRGAVRPPLGASAWELRQSIRQPGAGSDARPDGCAAAEAAAAGL